MILKLSKEIEKYDLTVWSEYILSIYVIYRIFSHSFRYFLLFWKRIFFILYKESKKIEK